MTPAKCQEAMMCGKIGPALPSPVLSLDGTLHFERGDGCTLEIDRQITPAKSQEEGACGETAQYLDNSTLLRGTSIFERSGSSVLKNRTSDRRQR